jgi:hypothetical protein
VDENKSIGQAPEQIGAGAWELWEWPGDGRTQNEPISVLDEVVKKIILAFRSDSGSGRHTATVLQLI